MNLDGLTLKEAITLITGASIVGPDGPTLPAGAPQSEPEPEREYGFCQVCERTLENCICEDGPY